MFAKKSKLQEMVDTATPHVESAVETARGKLVNDVIPAVQSAADQAREQAAPAAAEAARRGRAARAALKGEEAPKAKGGKLKKLLLIGGLAGAAAFAAKKLTGQDEQPWQQSYAPQQPPAAPTAVPTQADDVAGASPDEALADSQNGPHVSTTPDSPLEVNEIDAQPDENRL